MIVDSHQELLSVFHDFLVSDLSVLMVHLPWYYICHLYMALYHNVLQRILVDIPYF